MKKVLFLLFLLIISCASDDDATSDNEIYFPPLIGNTWETKTLNSLNWNENNMQPLLDYLEEKDSKGFIILHNGKIVVEEYFNKHSQFSNKTWNSAAKTLTGLTVGIAQQEGLLNINDKTSDYLGQNWTSLTAEKEDLITIKHQLTMTSGLDDSDFSSTNPDNLTYIADAGSRWAYHNGPYTLLQSVVANATNQSFNSYFNEKIKNKIGMGGFWFTFGSNRIYTSNTRSMARFGLLILNKGKWNDNEVLNDVTFYNNMTATSQNLNNSYGYLWWLNGKSSFRLPVTQQVFNGSMIPNAPNDMIMALGKDDQKIYIVPSKKLVVIRMGDIAFDSTLALSEFDNELWEKINLVIE